MSYAADKQTDRQTNRQTNNKQTDSKILPTPTNIVGVATGILIYDNTIHNIQ